MTFDLEAIVNVWGRMQASDQLVCGKFTPPINSVNSHYCLSKAYFEFSSKSINRKMGEMPKKGTL